MRKTQDFFKDLKIRTIPNLFFLSVIIFPVLINLVSPVPVNTLTVARTIIRPNAVNQQTCPVELQTLVDQMLPDLPSYTNRVIERRSNSREFERDTSVLIAGQLDELEPLPFNVNLDSPDETYLVYLKTWERQYYTNKLIRFQRYHWLFLRKSGSGWELEKMFSKSSSYPRYGFYSLPGETSESAFAQAIRLWLRDCQAK
ncbi:hypothetical protein M595_1548 [Lyngbya aestuarii BL J]|uniref:Uncharacterized protein n=1 Tax=Lyngbya aestuarii BL J TaxID=1348334 RepID=U7QKN0_9CYAN|nr:hypothetical protein [Lyngbya aestuarii]ERT08514.1 hypothetical protein M595_1548 [Lyngbya aestuarii BL J]